MKKNKLAVFDIDGTIFRSSLIIEVVDGLVEAGVFPLKAKEELEEDYLNWINRRGPYVTYIRKVVKVYLKYIKGCSEEDLKREVKKIIPKHKDKVYVYTRELIKDLKQKNYFLLAISGSSSYAVGEFAEALGFDGYFGAITEVIDGKFTGRDLVDVTWTKSAILTTFFKNNPQFKKEDAIGVGDSEIDIPFLDMVGNPIAFNPNRELVRYARKKGWKIMVERKDVIYELKDFNLKI